MRRAAAAAAVVAALAALAAVASAPQADASRYLRSGIYDDGAILYGNPDFVFEQLRRINTNIIRVTLYWGGPNGVARRRPQLAADPSDAAYDWSVYDRTVTYARQFGMQVVMGIYGTPAWANGARGLNVAPTKPADLRAFARAAATRYSGTYFEDGGPVLPVVQRWLAWNEPNSPVFLKPQYRKVGKTWVIESARQYAKICNAVVQGVRGAQPRGLVACGVTAPRGNNNPGSARASVSPLAFLRAMKRYGARGFQAYAHHPYYGSRKESPTTPPPPGPLGQRSTAVTMANLDQLKRELRLLYGPTRIWITEYGYQTRPPDRVFGVTWQQQYDYLLEAYELALRDPTVDMFIWFLLRDEQRLSGWQSGLFTWGWGRKLAREAFEQRQKLVG